jgi:peptidyl-prolyl cis-trans isomerase C
MENRISSRRTGTALASTFAIVSMFAAAPIFAQTVATVNGAEISTIAFDQYLQTRIQKPAAEATAEERENVLREMKDIYLLTTLPRAAELAKEEETKAMIELQYRAILAQAVVGDWLESNPATEEEILEAYNLQTLSAPDQQFKARHILVETQGAAVELITELDAGADFAELAELHSTGPSGASGGDLGWFSPNQMVAPFSDAVAGLENGAYTKVPVQTDFGWHVILREDSRNNEPPPLDSVRDVIKQNVEQEKFQTFLESLRTEGAE